MAKTFNDWIERYNPKSKWNWSNPYEIHDEIVNTIQECGTLDIEAIISLFAMSDFNEAIANY